MPSVYKVLGQSAPAATTNTDLYTVPAGTSAVCSTLCVVNRGTTTAFRVAVRPAGATLDLQHYIVYDSVVSRFNSSFMTLGLTLAATDVVTVYSATATLSFSLFGTEIS